MYTDPQWTALGFVIVDPTLPAGVARQLKLNHRPKDSDLVALLEKSPPEDETMALKWFEILCDCVSGRPFYLLLFGSVFFYCFVELQLGYLQKLGETPFVPVESTGYKGDIQRLQPKRCFLGEQPSELYSKLFAFVNFGTCGNKFLEFCGTKQQPSIEEVARILLADPGKAYKLANGREK